MRSDYKNYAHPTYTYTVRYFGMCRKQHEIYENSYFNFDIVFIYIVCAWPYATGKFDNILQNFV